MGVIGECTADSIQPGLCTRTLRHFDLGLVTGPGGGAHVRSSYSVMVKRRGHLLNTLRGTRNIGKALQGSISSQLISTKVTAASSCSRNQAGQVSPIGGVADNCPWYGSRSTWPKAKQWWADLAYSVCYRCTEG